MIRKFWKQNQEEEETKKDMILGKILLHYDPMRRSDVQTIPQWISSQRKRAFFFFKCSYKIIYI
jgi:hypothetical protein